jgi:hypothetical protein
MKFSRFIAVVSMGALGPALALLLPARALADECNGHINISYLSFVPPLFIGDTVDMRVDFGTGTITGGTGFISGPTPVSIVNSLTIKKFRIDLACNADNLVATNCVPDVGNPNVGAGMAVTLVDNSISDTCGDVDFSIDPLDITKPNVRTFTANPLTADPGLVIGALSGVTPPGLCSVFFTLKVNALSADVITPKELEEVVGYEIAECDNGVLLSGGFQTSSIPVEVIPPVNFDCYQVTQGRAPTTLVELEDRFTHTTGVKLAFEHRVCSPANKNDEDPAAVTNPQHLTGYGIKKGGGNANADVLVTNQFGTVAGHVGKAVRLLVPAAKALGKNVDPGQPPADLRHFQCYKFTADVDDFTVKLQDQFIVIEKFDPLMIDPAKSADVEFPKSLLLCAPVDKNGEDPDAAADPNALLCYQRTANLEDLPQDIKVSTRDQFQLDPTLKVAEFQELCVSSTVEPG